MRRALSIALGAKGEPKPETSLPAARAAAPGLVCGSGGQGTSLPALLGGAPGHAIIASPLPPRVSASAPRGAGIDQRSDHARQLLMLGPIATLHKALTDFNVADRMVSRDVSLMLDKRRPCATLADKAPSTPVQVTSRSALVS